MKIFPYTSKVATVVGAAFFVVVSIFPAHGAKARSKAGDFNNPDFAFPESVIRAAEGKLDSDPSDSELVKAVIQLVIAGGMKDRDNVSELTMRIDSLARNRGGATASVLYGLEARIVGEVFRNSPNVEKIILPLENPVSGNMNEWSPDMFCTRVVELCKKSVEDEEMLKATPIEEWRDILSDFDGEQAASCPNLYVFLTSCAIDVLPAEAYGGGKVIPFFDRSREKCSPGEMASDYRKRLIASLEDYARTHDLPLLLAGTLLKDGSRSVRPYSKFKEFMDAYESMSANPDSYLLLTSASGFLTRNDGNDDEWCRSRERYKVLLEDYTRRFPAAPPINDVKNCLTKLDGYRIGLDGSDRYRSDQPATVCVSGVIHDKTYYLKLFGLKCARPDKVTWDEMLADSRYSTVLSVKEIVGSGTVCNPDTVQVDLGQLAYGQYVLAVATSGGPDRRGLLDVSMAMRFSVTDLGWFAQNNSCGKAGSGVYAVDNLNGKPLEGLDVEVTRVTDSDEVGTLRLVTDSDGFVPTPFDEGNGRAYRRDSFVIRHRGDSITGSLHLRKYGHDAETRTINIYTDRGLYKPGEKLGYSVVAYLYGKERSEVIANDSVEVKLLNPSGVEVAAAKLITDRCGRADGEFILPSTGMNGDFNLIAGAKNNAVGYQWVRVADYKAPKFFVETKTSRKNYKLGDSIRVGGKVTTYSGMPVSGAKVNLTVSFIDVFGYRSGSQDSSYSCWLVSDSEGGFSIDLPTNLLDEKYERGFFTVDAEATAPSGETQVSGKARFCLGDHKEVRIDADRDILIQGKEITLKAVVNATGENVGPALLSYKLREKDTRKVVSEGVFESPSLSLAASDFPSGEYTWEVGLPDSDRREEADFTFYRLEDSAPPKAAVLWVPKDSYVVGAGLDSVDVRVGSSYEDQYVLCVVSGKNGFIESRWLNVSGTNTDVDVRLDPAEEVLFVDFHAMRDGKESRKRVKIQSENYLTKLEPEVVTFRDKIFAGDKESWRIRYFIGDTKASLIPVMATMTDKSLDGITPFNWSGLTRYAHTDRMSVGASRLSSASAHWTIVGKLLKVAGNVAFPSLNTYGMGLYGDAGYRVMRTKSGVVMLSRAPSAADGAAVNGSDGVPYADMAVESSAADAGSFGSADSEEKGEYRETECPVAFFMPNLSTDGEGVAELAFTPPDHNVTWVLQMLAYDPSNLKSNVSKMETVAIKRVMVQSQLPRFLRTGDECVLSFTAYNNSGEEGFVGMKAEVTDPLTDEVLVSRSFAPEKTRDEGSVVKTVSFIVPSDMDCIKVRVMASLGNHTDGEQALVGILPSSTPVTESSPFFLAPDVSEHSLVYPEGGEGSQTMFSYCDNPIWCSVTTLPDMTMPRDASILSTARALYGNAVALGLARRYPQIGEAVRLWSETNDSTLVSPLERDAAMKVTALGDTPWTLTAQSETLRMSRLTRLLDTTACAASINEALSELMRRQNPDGSWSWCADMRPSRLVTSRVLLYLGMLRQMGFLPDSSELEEVIGKAVEYCDRELCDDYIRNKKKISASQALDHLYVRSAFPDVAMTSLFRELKAKALKSIGESWRDFDIYDAALAAIVLYRNHNPRTPMLILESLRQKALSSPERGMWFANLSSSRAGRDRLVTTTRVLEAYDEINPKASEIDRLRQWLLIQRQSEDWGTAAETAGVVHAILTSGADWTVFGNPASFRVNGKDLNVSKIDAFTGSLTVPLANDGGLIEIVKSTGHQAWGGVLSRRIVPMEEVKSHGEGDIKITKTVVRVIEDEGGVRAEDIREGDMLHLGDKVRVQLMVSSRRDMDYVCLLDGRSACLSPIEQLSGYVWNQDAGHYRDVRNDSTNLFFDCIPKGVTSCSYDCFVTQEGVFSLGMAQIQCLYAPLQTAHTAGTLLYVK